MSEHLHLPMSLSCTRGTVLYASLQKFCIQKNVLKYFCHETWITAGIHQRLCRNGQNHLWNHEQLQDLVQNVKPSRSKGCCTSLKRKSCSIYIYMNATVPEHIYKSIFVSVQSWKYLEEPLAALAYEAKSFLYPYKVIEPYSSVSLKSTQPG